jgi:hypothetical protein
VSRRALWLVLVVLVLAYPTLVLTIDGVPSFPSRDDCARPVQAGSGIDAVFGYFDTEGEAVRVRDRALAVGFEGTELAWNGCGRVRVAVGGIPSLEVGRDFAKQARAIGFHVTLEQAAELAPVTFRSHG